MVEKTSFFVFSNVVGDVFTVFDESVVVVDGDLGEDAVITVVVEGVVTGAVGVKAFVVETVVVLIVDVVSVVLDVVVNMLTQLGTGLHAPPGKQTTTTRPRSS